MYNVKASSLGHSHSCKATYSPVLHQGYLLLNFIARWLTRETEATYLYKLLPQQSTHSTVDISPELNRFPRVWCFTSNLEYLGSMDWISRHGASPNHIWKLTAWG